jgi:hypothetical protein
MMIREGILSITYPCKEAEEPPEDSLQRFEVLWQIRGDFAKAREKTSQLGAIPLYPSSAVSSNKLRIDSPVGSVQTKSPESDFQLLH